MRKISEFVEYLKSLNQLEYSAAGLLIMWSISITIQQYRAVGVDTQIDKMCQIMKIGI